MENKSSTCFQQDDNAMQENDATVATWNLTLNSNRHLTFYFVFYFPIILYPCVLLYLQIDKIEKKILNNCNVFKASKDN